MSQEVRNWKPLFLAGSVLAVSIAVTSVFAHDPHKNGWPVPETARKLPNPLPKSDAVVKAGWATYMDNCAQCHGDTGKGDGPEAMNYAEMPSDFTDAHMMKEMTDGEIYYKMTEGKKPMPSFKKRLTDEQRWQLVHFLRTFVAPPAAPATAPAKKAPAKKSSPKKSP